MGGWTVSRSGWPYSGQHPGGAPTKYRPAPSPTLRLRPAEHTPNPLGFPRLCPDWERHEGA